MNNSLNIYNVITSGSYSVSEEKFTCDCLKTGDCFALCDYELSSKKSHVLECEFEKIEAVNGEFGIIFGVSDLECVPNKYFAATIDFKNKFVWLSGFCYGRTWRLRRKLNDNDLVSDNFKLRLEIVGQEISLYFNDVYLFSKKEKAYQGGNIGLYAKNAHVVFLNYNHIDATTFSDINISCDDTELVKVNELFGFSLYRYCDKRK